MLLTRRFFALFATLSASFVGGIEQQAMAAHPAEISIKETPAGRFFKGVDGTTLYFYNRDEDTPGKSACDVKCAKIWPPVTLGDAPALSGDWTLIARDDGIKQLGFKGRPLYRYSRDSYTGAAFGVDVAGWQVAYVPAPTPPGIEVSNTSEGYLLVDGNGSVLYANRAAKTSKPYCDKSCLAKWKPVSAPRAGHSTGPWTIVEAMYGGKQWAYDGRPLFTSANEAGLVREDRDQMEWQPIVLDPPRPKPPWATTSQSDMGKVVADSTGMTIYAFVGDLEGVNKLTCDMDCLRANWRPIAASGGERAIGDWSVVPSPLGGYQWALKGLLLFTYAKDEQPGDVIGDKFASGLGRFYMPGGGWWRPVMASCGCTLVP